MKKKSKDKKKAPKPVYKSSEHEMVFRPTPEEIRRLTGRGQLIINKPA